MHLTTKNGLPSNEIYNLYQDSKGFIWIASEAGLSRYDGTNFKTFYSSQMSSKSGSYIKEDNKHRIWYSNFDGQLFYIENDSLKSYQNAILSANPGEFFIHNDTIAYIERAQRLVIYEVNSKKLLQNHAIDYVYTNLFQDEYGFQIISRDGIYFYSNQLKKEHFIPTINNHFFTKAIRINSRYYTIAQNKGSTILRSFEGNSSKTLFSEQNAAYVQGFHKTGNDLWLLKRDGAIKFNTQNEQLTRLLPGESCSHILKDKNGIYWISTLNNGIFLLNSESNRNLSKLPFEFFKLKTVSDHLFIIEKNGSVHVWNEHGSEKLFQLPNQTNIYDIIDVTTYSLSSNDKPSQDYHLFKYNNRQFMAVSSGIKSISAIDNKYVALSISGFAGILSFASKQSIHSEWDPIYHTLKNQYNKPNIQYGAGVLHDVRTHFNSFNSKTKTIFYATNIGLYTLTPVEKKEIKYQNKSLYLSDMRTNGQDVFLLGTSGDLFFKSPDDSIIFCQELNKYGPFKRIKISDSVLVCQNDKQLYYLTLHKKNYSKAVFEGQLNVSTFIHDILDIEIYKNKVYIGLPNTLRILNINNQSANEHFDLVINQVRNLHNVNATSAVRTDFNHTENNIHVSFSILDFYNSINTLSYSVNNDEWVQLSPSSRSINLTSLSPGDYQIQIKINDVINPTKLTFSIQKPWYKTWLFISLAAVALTSSIIGIYRIQIQRSKTKNRLLLEKATLEKDLRQSMLSSIKAQMNPHFLFNALNTIQSYIITEDKENASNYLSKFSKLTRKILEMSDKESITLEEELDALILYIELEKMRFQDLNFTIGIANDVNPKVTFIPSMIIQPYIENAIKHGLLHKSGDKNLSILIHRDNQYLRIDIEDNGIGRDKSILINKNRKHNSFATQANMKRIELLNLEKNNIGVDYKDKKDNEGNPLGTSVTIHIPYKTQP